MLPLTKSLDCDRAQAETSLAGGTPSQEVPMRTIQILSPKKRSSRNKPSRSWPITVLAVALTVGFAQGGIVAPAVAQEKMTTPTPAQEKPNILFIMGDDIGWMQPSIYHEGLAVGETPNIDRIGHEGAKFMTYYAEQSCTAGRTAFITGMQPVRVGMVLPEIPGSPSYLRTGTPDTRQVPARSRLHHRRVRQEPSWRYHRVAPHGERVPGILGLSLSPRCHAAGELPRHQQVPDGADHRTTLQKHADPGLV